MGPDFHRSEPRLRIEAWILGLFVVGGYVSLGFGFWQRLTG